MQNYQQQLETIRENAIKDIEAYLRTHDNEVEIELNSLFMVKSVKLTKGDKLFYHTYNGWLYISNLTIEGLMQLADYINSIDDK